jgi:hypothetical protein
MGAHLWHQFDIIRKSVVNFVADITIYETITA